MDLQNIVPGIVIQFIGSSVCDETSFFAYISKRKSNTVYGISMIPVRHHAFQQTGPVVLLLNKDGDHRYCMGSSLKQTTVPVDIYETNFGPQRIRDMAEIGIRQHQEKIDILQKEIDQHTASQSYFKEILTQVDSLLDAGA